MAGGEGAGGSQLVPWMATQLHCMSWMFSSLYMSCMRFVFLQTLLPIWGVSRSTTQCGGWPQDGCIWASILHTSLSWE